MSGISDARANAILEHESGKTDIGALPSPYLGLSSTKPSDVGGNITEPSGAGYARVACSGATWGTAASRAIANAAAVTFAASTGAWLAGATLGFWVLWSAITDGTVLRWGVVSNPPSVAAAGAAPNFPIGSLTSSSPSTQ